MPEWREMYDAKAKPRFAEIKAFLSEEAFSAFERFNDTLNQRYGLGYVRPWHSANNGWVYSYGRSGLILVKSVTFHPDYFTVEGIGVHNTGELSDALLLVDRLFQDGFLIRFADFCEARTKRRRERQGQRPAVSETEYKRNCKWCPKVSRQDITRLYHCDALGLPDEELLEEIGLTLYVRCKTAREIYDLMEQGKIKCMECGVILSGGGELACQCGCVYTYHAYRKSYREDNMPRGAASPIFDKFVSDWEHAKSPADKMRLVDSLLHEFHVAEISGTQGRPVGVNLIEGTKPQIIRLLCELARS